MDNPTSSASSDPAGHPRPLPGGAIVIAALGVGLACDLLLRATGGPGLNVFLLFAGLALAVGAVSHRAGLRLSREALTWLSAGLLLAAGLVLRASPALQVLAFLAAAAAFALPALRAGAAWLRRSGVADQVEAIFGAMVHTALGPLPLLLNAGGIRPDGAGARQAGRSSGRPVQRVLLGILLAAPLLLVFGALFMSADPVFAGMVTDLLGVVDLEKAASHLLVTGLFAWLACGYLSGFLAGTRLRGWVTPVAARPSIGILEAGTALALLDLLFAAFVLVQIRYLFGGSGLVEITPGLTYAEYAREGFGQLVVATGLVLPCLLASDWLLRRDAPRDARVFRLLGGLQLLLLLVVIASAIQRVRVYQEAYGLTESRFYGAVFLGWLTLLTIWFAATVLRGHRDRFAAPALVSGFALVAALLLANPDARIARANLARAGVPASAVEAGPRAGLTDPPPLDAAYLSSLSADAAPTLIRSLPALPAEARCTIAAELLRRWGPERSTDWRAWTWAEARARRLLQDGGERWLEGCPVPAALRSEATD
jgi:hypothetical protein